MKIARVTVQWLRIPLPRPISFSIKTLAYRDYLLVRLVSDEGIEGIGVTLNDRSAAPAMSSVCELLAPAILGRDPRDITRIWEDLYWQNMRAGRRGNLVFGLSAIDIALWDHQGKVAGQPLYKLLGGYRDEVPCYASGGYYHQVGNDYDQRQGLAGLEQELTGYCEAGFEAVKIKIGRLPLALERERVSLAREILGADRELLIDATQAWTDVETAVRFGRMCEEHGAGWFEEPLPVEMINGFQKLGSRLRIPIATGEVGATRWEFQQLIRAGIDVSQHDATACGGVTEWINITALCSAAGVSVAPHYFWDIHVQLGASRREVTWLEFFPGDDIVNFDLVLENPLEATKGRLPVRSGAGLGLELDERAVRQYLYSEKIVEL